MTSNENHKASADIQPLYFNGDARLQTLTEAIEDAIFDRCQAYNIPGITIIGALDFVKAGILKRLHDAD
jgi:hypothetical protein